MQGSPDTMQYLRDLARVARGAADTDPHLALVLARKAVEELLRALLERDAAATRGEVVGLALNELLKRARAAGLSGLQVLHIQTIRGYGNSAAHGKIRQSRVTTADVEPAVAALASVISWFAGEALPPSGLAVAMPRQSVILKPIERRDEVLHRANAVDVFEVLLVIPNAIPGGPALCKCVLTADEDFRLYNFLSSDLLLVSAGDCKLEKNEHLADYESKAKNCRFQIGDFAKHLSQEDDESAPEFRILDIRVPVRESGPCMCVCECPARIDDREMQNYLDVELVPVQKVEDGEDDEDLLGADAKYGVDIDAQIDEPPPANRPRTFSGATRLLLRKPH